MTLRRMASLFSLSSRPQALFRLASTANRSACRRNFHLTVAARQTQDDDLFSFAIPSETSVAEASESTTTLKAKAQDAATRREQQFYELVQYVTDHTGRKRAIKAGQVRQTAWLQLFQLATSSEQLEMVVELFPRWRDSGKEFRSTHAEAFIRRCEELECPTLALKVFGDHPKYGLGLSSLFAARHMLHSVYDKRPLSDSITVAALFGVYKLPPVSSDLAACSMLYIACLKDKSANARIVGKALYEELKKQVRDKPPVTAPKESVVRARYAEKPNIWLLDALKTIERIHKKAGKDWKWIRYWTGERVWRPRNTFTAIQSATTADHA